MPSLTTIILTQNSQTSLKDTLESVTFADEIIVIDDNSIDETINIAKKFGAKVFNRNLESDFSESRNFGLSKAKSEWILFLDSDEVVSKNLAKEIKLAIKNNFVSGYYIKRRDNFLGKNLNFGETNSAKFLRLAQIKSGKWKGKVHEVWEVEGKTGELENSLLHNSHQDLNNFFEKLNVYSSIEVESRIVSHTSVSLWQMFVFPFLKFFYNLIVLQGIRDGWRGLILAYFMSLHSLMVRIKHLEKKLPSEKIKDTKINFFEQILIILFYGICMSLSLGQLIRIQINLSSAIYLHDILIPMFVLFVGTNFIILKNKINWSDIETKFKWGIFLAGGLLFWIWISWFLNLPVWGFSKSITGLLYLMRFTSYSLFGICLIVSPRYLRKNLSKGLMLLLLSSLNLAFAQYIFFPDTRILLKLGWDDHLNRLIFPWFDPGFTGLVFGIGFFYSILKNKFLPFLPILLFLGIMLTYSRASILAFIIGLLAILVFDNKYRSRALIWVCLTCVLYFLLPQTLGEGVDLTRTQSIESRIETTQSGLTTFKHNPIFGLGFNNYTLTNSESDIRIPYHPSSPDNSFVFILTVSGIIGGILFITTILWLFLSNFNSNILISVLTLIISVHSFFNNSWFYPFVYLPFLIILSLELTKEKKKL